MIGVYDYTVVLTYLSLLSASAGIATSLSGNGHPYIGIFCLLFCGLCDAFDGKVARTKKNRTEYERSFGIQIDSFCDLAAFGILPICIGVACLRVSPIAASFSLFSFNVEYWYIKFPVILVMFFYVLAALVRLSHFNVTEDERQKEEGGVRTTYTGLPVTTAALIFPTVLLFQYVLSVDLSFLYLGLLLITGFCFVLKFTVPKLGTKGILAMMAIGLIESIALVLFLLSK